MPPTPIEIAQNVPPAHTRTQGQTAWLLNQARSLPAFSPRAWHLLEAAHIAGQLRPDSHVRVHLHMLARAWQERHWHEIIGQLIRLALVPLGHTVQRLPIGNPGTSRVGALTPQPVPTHLSRLIAQSDAAISASTIAFGD